MGEEQKKEKNRVEGSKAFIEKYFIKKKNYTASDLRGGCWVSVGAVGFQMLLLGFGWSYGFRQ